MKLIIHGQQAFGKAVLESLLERGEDVCAVYCAPDKGSPVSYTHLTLPTKRIV